MKEDVYIGLLGFGTVGQGVYKLVERENLALTRQLGCKLKIAKILVRDKNKPRNVKSNSNLLTTDPSVILSDPNIDIIVELIGGCQPASKFVIEAMKNGKSVVTANKELLASQGAELFEAANKYQVDLFFEGSVGGGIPIIRPLKEELVGNQIKEVMGIVNGTTNYILTKMAKGKPFKEVLLEAQKLGYAEANPEADISGADAGAKIAILASIAFNSRVTASQVFTEGIAKITPKDIMYAYELGYVVKLIALAKEEKGYIDVRVHPTMIPISHPLATVEGVYNAVFVVGDAVGELMFFGKGAGSLPTASAVLGDVFQAALNKKFNQCGRISCTCYINKPIKTIEAISSHYYMLMEVADQPGVLAQIASVFGKHDVSLSSVIQKESRGKIAEVVFMTHKVLEGNLQVALAEINKLPVVEKICNLIRVETGNA